jgi:quinol-cytochrome oxidoreductase complex cytochrome b subunit
MFFVMRKKQSPAEVASDERDNMVRTKAVQASLISLLVMFPALAYFMVLASNDEGMVNAFITIPFSVLILLIAMAVYSITTLVQYGIGTKEEHNE